MLIQNSLLYFFVYCSLGCTLYPMQQQAQLRETASLQLSSKDSDPAEWAEWYQEYMGWIQQKLVTHALPNIPPSLVGLYQFLNTNSPVSEDIGTSLPEGQLVANSTAFHASTLELPYRGYHSLIQRELIAQILFDRTDSLSQDSIIFLCGLKKVRPILYQNHDKVLLPGKVRQCSVKVLIHLLTSDKKNVADAGRKILKQRGAELQHILEEKDDNDETALAKESARKALNKDYSSKTLLNPALYDLHFTPFVAALRTRTLYHLPDSNVFKVAYAQVTFDKRYL